MTVAKVLKNTMKKSRIYQLLIQQYEFYKLSKNEKKEFLRDKKGIPDFDPGPERSIVDAIDWICRAQDSSAKKDGGVASHYSLATGWSSSYPETTGYIIPTVLEYAQKTNNDILRQRAKKDARLACQHTTGERRLQRWKD